MHCGQLFIVLSPVSHDRLRKVTVGCTVHTKPVGQAISGAAANVDDENNERNNGIKILFILDIVSNCYC